MPCQWLHPPTYPFRVPKVWAAFWISNSLDPPQMKDNRTGRGGQCWVWRGMEINAMKAPGGISINRLRIRLIFSLRHVHLLLALRRTFYFIWMQNKSDDKTARKRERDAEERETGRSYTCRAHRCSQIAGLEVCSRRVLGFSVFRAMFDVSCQKIHRRRPIDCRRLSMHTACCAAFWFAIFLAYAYVWMCVCVWV